MRNINRVKEASVALIAIVIVVIIAVAGFFVFTTSGSTTYWETQSSFGAWQEEIIVEFEDGTTESLKIIQEQKETFSVMYGGKAITKVRWLISGIATGTGYTKAVVDRSGVSTHWYIKSGGTIKEEGMFSMSGTTDLYIGGQPGTVNFGEINVITKMDENPSKYPDGTYTITFSPQGTVEYWGMPQDEPVEKKTASLPPARAIGVNVERTPTGQILVTVNSKVVTYS